MVGTPPVLQMAATNQPRRLTPAPAALHATRRAQRGPSCRRTAALSQSLSDPPASQWALRAAAPRSRRPSPAAAAAEWRPATQGRSAPAPPAGAHVADRCASPRPPLPSGNRPAAVPRVWPTRGRARRASWREALRIGACPSSPLAAPLAAKGAFHCLLERLSTSTYGCLSA